MRSLYTLYLFTFFALYAGLATARIIKTYHVDVILERESSLGAGAIASLLTGRPMVLEIIGPRYSRLSLKRAKKIIAYTRSMIREAVPEQDLRIVSAAVDVKTFTPNSAAGRRVRLKHDLGESPVIGYVGTFQTWHGVEDLVCAAQQVLARLPSAKFLMVGPYFRNTKLLASQKGLAKAFVFTGPVSHTEIPDLINASDVLVAPYDPSRSGLRKKYGMGSPLKIFEYMACRKPVIATSVEPITEIVEDQVTGILVPPGDSEALAKAIIKVIEAKDLAAKIATKARRMVIAKYSWENLARQLQDFLMEATTSSGSASPHKLA